jgi:PAS domain S-box-containing protein
MDLQPRENEILRTATLVARDLAAVYRFRRAPDGRFFFDYMSAAAMKMLQIESTADYENVEHTFPHIHGSERKAFLESIEQSVQNLTPWHYRFPYVYKDGSTHYFDARSTPEKQDDGSIIWHGIFMDVTSEQRHKMRLEEMAEQMQRQTEILEEAQEVARVGSWEVNVETSLSKWSRQTARIFGKPDAEGLTVAEGVSLYIPEHQEEVRECVDVCIETGEPFDREWQIIRQDGERLWVRVIGHAEVRDGKTTRLYGVFQDVDERKQAERKLREQEQRLNLAVNAAQLALWDYDLARHSGFVNRRWTQMLGLDYESFRPSVSEWSNLIHPEDRKEVMRKFHDHAEGKTEFFNAEYRLRTRDEQWLWVRDNGCVVQRDGQGKPVRVSGLMQDITNSKTAEETLRENKEIAEAANRSKDEFLAMMSHELRTPLNGILGFADILRGTTMDEDQLEYVRMIRSSGVQLMDIITDILDFSKLQARKLDLEMSRFNPRQCVRDAANTVRPMAEAKNLKVTVEEGPDLPVSITQDGERIKQILVNLVNNGIKFTEEGGVRVTVDLEKGHDLRNWLVIKVIDTGVGIPEDHMEDLFEPFVQVDSSLTRKHGGTGLGLSICKKLCDLLQGSLRVVSEVDEGSTFILRIPVELDPHQEQEIARHETTPIPQQLAMRHPLEILVVEDDAINARLIAVLLKRLGYEPIFTTNGREALEVLEEKEVDLVLMDVQMPVLNGLEATQAIRRGRAGERNKGLHIIGLTALAMPLDHERCLESGMNDCITKPLKTSVLLRTLKEVHQNLGR